MKARALRALLAHSQIPSAFRHPSRVYSAVRVCLHLPAVLSAFRAHRGLIPPSTARHHACNVRLVRIAQM